MVSRSVGWLICFFVAVVTAGNYREPVSITGSDPGATVHRLRTDNSEWSVLGSGQKFEETAGSTRLVVDRAIVAAQSPALVTALEHHVMGTSRGLGTVPVVEDALMRQILALLHTLQAPQLPNMAPQLPNMAAQLSKTAPQLSKTAPQVPNMDPQLPNMDPQLPNMEPQLPNMEPQLPNMDPQLPNMDPQLPNMDPQLPNMAPGLLSSPSTDGATHLKPECKEQHLSAETAVAAAMRAIKHSCDSQRQAAVGFIKDHLGEVLATQGWEHALRTQPEEVVQLSWLLAEKMAATSTPATAHTTTATTTTTKIADQPQSDTAPPAVTCPTTPLDEDAISGLRILPDEEKGKLLIAVAKEGEVESLRTLLAAGALPGERDTHGRTALQWAAWRGHAEVARCLLDARADLETMDNDDYRPLHMAAMGGYPAMVRLLASLGADPNAQDVWGWTPLHLTVRDHHPEAALALLEVGANKEIRNKSGFTPLIMARKSNNQPLIDVLTQY